MSGFIHNEPVQSQQISSAQDIDADSVTLSVTEMEIADMESSLDARDYLNYKRKLESVRDVKDLRNVLKNREEQALSADKQFIRKQNRTKIYSGATGQLMNEIVLIESQPDYRQLYEDLRQQIKADDRLREIDRIAKYKKAVGDLGCQKTKFPIQPHSVKGVKRDVM